MHILQCVRGVSPHTHANANAHMQCTCIWATFRAHLLTSCERTTSCVSACSRRLCAAHSLAQVQSQIHTARIPDSAIRSTSSVTSAPIEMASLGADGSSAAAVVLAA